MIIRKKHTITLTDIYGGKKEVEIPIESILLRIKEPVNNLGELFDDTTAELGDIVLVKDSNTLYQYGIYDPCDSDTPEWLELVNMDKVIPETDYIVEITIEDA